MRTYYARFRCLHCGHVFTAGRTASHCPGCHRGPTWNPYRPALQVLERNTPGPLAQKDAEIARLQALVRSLAERCYVQHEALARLAERRCH